MLQDCDEFVNERVCCDFAGEVFSCDTRGARVASLQMNRNTLEYKEEEWKYGIVSFSSFILPVVCPGWGVIRQRRWEDLPTQASIILTFYWIFVQLSIP